MQLTDKDIREFQSLWEQYFDEKISAHEAEEEAQSLLIFLQTILKK